MEFDRTRVLASKKSLIRCSRQRDPSFSEDREERKREGENKKKKRKEGKRKKEKRRKKERRQIERK